MPRKAVNTKEGQGKPRKRTVDAKTQKLYDEDATNDAFMDEDQDEDDNTNMLEMMALIQDFRKRTTGKNNSKSAAFTAKKNALYAKARENSSNAVRDGVAYIEQYKTIISNLKEQEVSQDQRMQGLRLFKAKEDAVHALLDTFPPMFEDLSHRRATMIDETSAMLEDHSAYRHESRRNLIKNAKARLDEDMENQRIATDASALIKHYKALLLH